MAKTRETLNALISLGEFMAVLGADARDEETARFCLEASTAAIESHCRRRLLRRRNRETINAYGDLFLPLAEYPVTKICAIAIAGRTVEPNLYAVAPVLGLENDLPFSITLSPRLGRLAVLGAATVDYWSGYPAGKIPADLAAACLELASWNMGRYRGRRVGMTGSVAGNWRDKEHFEMSMPENVLALLEPYRRRTI